jgi:hypothetical protein
VTIPGQPGTWESQDWDVTRITTGDIVQWFIPEYAEVLAIQVVDADTMRLQLNDHKGLPNSVKVVTLPRTLAAQVAAGIVIHKLTQPLKHRSWWQEVGSAAVFYVRNDGLLVCESAGGQWVPGSIVTRDLLGSLVPVTA